jgi:hypothetical protein
MTAMNACSPLESWKQNIASETLPSLLGSSPGICTHFHTAEIYRRGGRRDSLVQIKSPLSAVRADRNLLEGIAGDNRIAPDLTELNVGIDVVHLSAVAAIE